MITIIVDLSNTKHDSETNMRITICLQVSNVMQEQKGSREYFTVG